MDMDDETINMDDKNDDGACVVEMKVERRFAVPKRQISFKQGKITKYTCKLNCLEDNGLTSSGNGSRRGMVWQGRRRAQVHTDCSKTVENDEMFNC